MNIKNFRTLNGPNVYSYEPVVTMKLDLEDLANVESCAVDGFVDRLLDTLPGLEEHHCALGRRGGFIERLREGTFFGHVVEHVALELTDAAGISVNRGKTVSTDEPGVYLVAVACKSERGMKHLLRVAVELVQALIRGDRYDLAPQIEEARRIVAEYQLGPSTKAVVEAAHRRGIPTHRIGDDSLVRLGHGCLAKRIQATTTDRTSIIGVDIAGNKQLTKRVLADAGIPAPDGCVVRTRDEAAECLQRVKLPLVVKPLDGNQGRGVSLNLVSPDQVMEAFDLASEVSPDVIVEEMYRGNDYRVVVVNGKMVAAAQRIPAHVWGDDQHTIRELIDIANHDPLRGDHHEKPLTKISTDPLVLAILKRHGRTLDDVPKKGEMVLLRESANLSTGGMAKDVTDCVHPSFRRMCERAARVVGLDVCGVDLVVPDITQPFDGRGGIVEVNASPGIRMHHFPSEGQARDVGGAIVDMLFPQGSTGRIPLLSITGTNGKTTVTRLVRHILGATGRTVGMTTTDGIWIGDEEVARGDMTGPWSANVVLSDPSVEVAVLETARGGIVRSGLAYDWSDVGVITNIQADHIGQDGIETLDDILWIKRLVAERVREGGTVVLNADDPLLVGLPNERVMQRISRRIVFFSLDGASPVVQQHVAAGGTAFVSHAGWLEERSPDGVHRIARVDAIPATLGGTADFQIANVLASAAACRAVGVDAHTIASALGSFRLDQHSAGRLNLFALSGGYVLLDYGHNPAAIQAVCRTVSQWGATRITQVMTVPGDRSTALIEDAARAALCGPDRVIVREDVDRRGRRHGEIADILASVLRRERPTLPVEVVLDELEAVATAVREMQPGELVVALCEDLDAVRQWLTERGATPVQDFRPLTARELRSAQPAA
jgi:cyanophycin synthetase